MTTAIQRSCLVLGGKGFVGAAIVEEARRRGYAVRVVDKDEYAGAAGAACDVLVNANGNSRKFLARENPALEFDLSVRSVLQSLQDFKAARYVHLSTMDVYPEVSDPARNGEDALIDPALLSPYGFHKFLAEQVVRYYAPHWLVFRMAGFVGRGLWKNSVHDILSGQPLRVHPDSQYQYLNTADLARIVFTAIEAGAEREILNVAGHGVVSLREVAAMCSRATLDPALDKLPRERYELNVEKIGRYGAVPETRQTVQAFVDEWMKSRGGARP